MFTLPNDPQYAGLQQKIFKSLAEANVQHQIFTAVAQAYDNALAEHSVILSRTERKRLLAQVTHMVLTDMLAKLENPRNNK